MSTETLAVLISAAVWWVPTFIAATDLQQRDGLPRHLVWKWSAVLAIPVAGAALYWFRGRPELDHHAQR
ncbi:MAG: hypothetical protein ACR2MA_03425 [Egibacteraceae bacterium]